MLLSGAHALCLAAPHTITPNLDDEKGAVAEPVPTATQPDPNLTDSLVVTEPPRQSQSEGKGGRQYYFPYRQSMSPHLGLGITQDLQALSFIGVFYQLPDPHARHWEFGAAVQSNGLGRFLFLYKRIFQAHGKVRPYYSFGLNLRAVGSEGLPTFFNPRNLGVAGFIGLEEVFASPMSWRADLSLTATQAGATLNMTLGYSWAW